MAPSKSEKQIENLLPVEREWAQATLNAVWECPAWLRREYNKALKNFFETDERLLSATGGIQIKPARISNWVHYGLPKSGKLTVHLFRFQREKLKEIVKNYCAENNIAIDKVDSIKDLMQHLNSNPNIHTNFVSTALNVFSSLNLNYGDIEESSEEIINTFFGFRKSLSGKIIRYHLRVERDGEKYLKFKNKFKNSGESWTTEGAGVKIKESRITYLVGHANSEKGSMRSLGFRFFSLTPSSANPRWFQGIVSTAHWQQNCPLAARTILIPVSDFFDAESTTNKDAFEEWIDKSIEQNVDNIDFFDRNMHNYFSNSKHIKMSDYIIHCIDNTNYSLLNFRYDHEIIDDRLNLETKRKIWEINQSINDILHQAGTVDGMILPSLMKFQEELTRTFTVPSS